jgi:phospholipid transport system substrate-binding protein
MSFIRSFWVVMALVVAILTGAASASASEDSLRKYVEKNTDDLVQKLNEERSLYRNDPQAFYASMEKALQGFMDFRRIAARVMGRYAHQASPEQRDAFVEKFKRSLFDSYAKALLEAEDFSISVLEAEINPNNEDRAQVNLRVETASGKKYPITYSMYKDDSGKWLMENVIAEGVNIGLAFRDRFGQEMEENRGNVQAVIDGWSDSVKDFDIEKEADKS